MILLNTIDICKYSTLTAQNKSRIEALAKEHNAYLIQMSNINGEGISDVKEKSCEILLEHRLIQKAKDPKKAEGLLNRLHIA